MNRYMTDDQLRAKHPWMRQLGTEGMARTRRQWTAEGKLAEGPRSDGRLTRELYFRSDETGRALTKKQIAWWGQNVLAYERDGIASSVRPARRCSIYELTAGQREAMRRRQAQAAADAKPADIGIAIHAVLGRIDWQAGNRAGMTPAAWARYKAHTGKRLSSPEKLMVAMSDAASRAVVTEIVQRTLRRLRIVPAAVLANGQFSLGWAFEDVRWDAQLRNPTDTAWKVDNDWGAPLTRAFMLSHPEYMGLMDTRQWEDTGFYKRRSEPLSDEERVLWRDLARLFSGQDPSPALLTRYAKWRASAEGQAHLARAEGQDADTIEEAA